MVKFLPHKYYYTYLNLYIKALQDLLWQIVIDAGILFGETMGFNKSINMGFFYNYVHMQGLASLVIDCRKGEE